MWKIFNDLKKESKTQFFKTLYTWKKKPTELKPIDVLKNEDLTTYSISYNKHENQYDFFNAGDIVEEFLFNAKVASKSTATNKIFKV